MHTEVERWKAEWMYHLFRARTVYQKNHRAKSQILEAAQTNYWDLPDELRCGHLHPPTFEMLIPLNHVTDTMAHSPFQVGMDIVKAVVLGQIDQDTCGTSAVSLPAEAAVADSTAWGAPPRLHKRGTTSPFSWDAMPDVTHTHNLEECPATHWVLQWMSALHKVV